jgi:hypothetical protein
MNTPLEPRAEYCDLTEAEILKALDDDYPTNPIAIEVRRLIAGYAGNFRAEVHRLGRIPSYIPHIKPRWPIEAVAMRLTTKLLAESF